MNPTEFRAFYNDCWKYCKPRLRNLTTNQADIEDVFAEAISRFWVNAQQGKITHADNHFALVYVMAKTCGWVNYVKKNVLLAFRLMPEMTPILSYNYPPMNKTF